MTASAPRLIQELAIWPEVTVAASIQPNAASVIVRTSTSAGKIADSPDLPALARPRKPTGPRRLVASGSRARTGIGYSRATAMLAAAAIRTGLARVRALPGP